MKPRMVAALFALLLVEKAYTSDLELARKFSPILILTEDTGNRWGDIRVTKPEPVGIMGAHSANSLQFHLDTHLAGGDFFVSNWRDFNEFDPPPAFPNVDFANNLFAHLGKTHEYSGVPAQGYLNTTYRIQTLPFQYPGNDPTGWNATYFGEEAGSDASGSAVVPERPALDPGYHQSWRGSDFRNTAYVHVYKEAHDAYTDSITVIQYFYFYPYNHFWNRHEGDWPRVHVVVSSGDPMAAEVIGVEYLFHKAHLSYYEDYTRSFDVPPGVGNSGGGTVTTRMPDLTSDFVFDPQKEVKLSQGTHPVVYVGAGSHASYPFGGKTILHSLGDGDYKLGAVYEWMTHTGLVLSTQANASHGDLWETYDLVLLPEPDPDDTDNMGLTGSRSWLGVDVRWGTTEVPSPDSDPDGVLPIFGPKGNESPRGPYYEGWESLKFFTQGFVGERAWFFDFTRRPFRYSDAPDSYHHWTIIGQESWNETASASDDTLSLSGDVVVFPGATLTINAGTVIE
ncbi:MAG: hypothetical protein OXG13_05235, partial [Gemmatimonadaceae bacterium]|nr:hypothetical protein [Gemmatimonadaceae bacterium]